MHFSFKIKILLVVLFLFFLPNVCPLEIGVVNLTNKVDLNYINLDSNQAIFRFDIDNNFEVLNFFYLNNIFIDINSPYLFTNFLLFKDTNKNKLFDFNDSLIPVNLSFSQLINKRYSLDIDSNIFIDSNASYFLIANFNFGIGTSIDFNITDINISVDKNIIYSNNIKYIIAPKQIIQNGFISNNSIFLDYYSISDVNGNYIEDIDLNDFSMALDLNQFNLFIDNNNYRDYGIDINLDLNIKENYNTLNFDLENALLKISNNINFSLDYNLSYFNILDDYLYLVNDKNLYIYDYNSLSYDFNLISFLDTNDIIYSLDTFDFNSHKYLFLANNGNGIVIYDISDNNINDVKNNYVGNVLFKDGSNIYNTNFLKTFTTPNNLDYLISFATTSGVGGIGLYKIEDLIDLNSTLGDGQIIYRDTDIKYIVNDYLFDKDNNCFYIDYNKEKNSFYKFEYAYDSNTVSFEIFNPIKKKYLSFLKLNNMFFAINSNENKVEAYDYSSFFDNAAIFKSTYTPSSQKIYSMTSDKDNNKLYILLKDKVEVLDYNFDSNNFSLDYNISLIDPDFNLSYTSKNLLFENKALYVGQENHFSFFNHSYDNLDFNLIYYIPTPSLSFLGLSKENIDYSLYNNPDFNGELTLSFNLLDYNIEVDKSSLTPYKANIYFKNSTNQYDVINNLDLNLDVCQKTENQRVHFCKYTFNIKELNSSLSIKSSNDYDFYIYLIDNKKFTSFPFIFNLNKPLPLSSGGSGNNDSGNENKGGGNENNQINYLKSEKALKEKKINNLELLKKDYISLKELFTNFFLNLPEINFEVDKNSSFDLFNYKYNLILEAYDNLPIVEIKERKEVDKDYILDSNFDYLNYSKINKDIKKYYTEIHLTDKNKTTTKYVFFEISLVDFNKEKIIDFLPISKILKSSSSINLFDINSSFVYYTTDVNFLISYKDLNSFSFKPIVLIKNSNDINSYNVFNNDFFSEPKNSFLNKINILILLIIFGLIVFSFLILRKLYLKISVPLNKRNLIEIKNQKETDLIKIKNQKETDLIKIKNKRN